MPSSDDPSVWSSGAFIADELDDDPSHKAPSTASDIQVEPHRPIVFSSAFSAASRARPAGNPITPRYANQFAAHEALFPFGAGTSGASASTAFGGEQAYGYTGSGGAVESPYDLPGYDLRGTAAAALEGLPPQQEILPMVEEEVALDPALAQTGKKRKGKRPAKSRTKKAASGKSTPARRSRSISEKEEDLAVDPEFETEREQAAEQDAKRKRAASKKKFGRPPLPAVFGAGDAEEEKKALMRGMDPCVSPEIGRAHV